MIYLVIISNLAAVLLGQLWLFILVNFWSGSVTKNIKQNLSTHIPGIALSWMVSCYILDAKAHGLISTRLAGLLGSESQLYPYLMTSLLGALVGSLFALCGYYFNSAFKGIGSRFLNK